MAQIDPNNPTYAKLSRYAARVETLLKKAAVKGKPGLVASLDDFLGILYSLFFARESDFTDRLDRKIDPTAVEKRAHELASGPPRPKGKWMAGFHFNSALFRTSAVYHRILKIIIEEEGDVPTLRAKAKERYKHWSSDYVQKVHKQVNELKHKPRGTHDRRTVGYQDALAAPGELLDLLEAAIT